LTAAVFTPQWISTGPEPGLVAIMAVLAFEMIVIGSKQLHQYWMDTALLLVALVCTTVLGGLPGMNVWAVLGGCLAAVPALMIYSRRLGHDSGTRCIPWQAGVVLAVAAATALCGVFWGATDGETVWCQSCKLACYSVSGWCNPTNVSG
jgi:hypothetical protein